jgi:hypothetical protein
MHPNMINENQSVLPHVIAISDNGYYRVGVSRTKGEKGSNHGQLTRRGIWS